MNTDFIFLNHLATWRHFSEKEPIGRVILIHGICEHSGRHFNTIRHLTSNSFEVIRFDLRGAGESKGRRQWVDKFEQYIDDVLRVYEWALNLPKLPIFLLGHSMGGLIAIYFASRYNEKLNGLVLSAPANIAGNELSRVTIAIGKILSIVFPKLYFPSKISDFLTNDPKVIEAYKKDPLSYHGNTLRQGKEVLEAMKTVEAKSTKIFCPVLIFHGSNDKIVKPQGSFNIFMKLGSKDRTMHFIPHGYHELHNDTEKNHYLTLLLNWLKKHSNKF